MENENVKITVVIELSQDTWKHIRDNASVGAQLKRAAEKKLYQLVNEKL